MSKATELSQECQKELDKFTNDEMVMVEEYVEGMNEFAQGSQTEDSLRKIVNDAGYKQSEWLELFKLRYTISGVSGILLNELVTLKLYAETYREQGNTKGLPKQVKKVKEVLKKNGIK